MQTNSESSPRINDKELNEALNNVLDIVEMEQEREYVSNAELFDQLLTAFSQELDSQLIPTTFAKDYAGLHLGQTYEDSEFKLLLRSFKNNQVLDAFYALKIVKDAKEKFKSMHNIRECIIDDPLENGCIVVGDLHGNFNDLYHIIQKYGIPGAQFKFIFNGDYVDRGKKQVEVFLTILYAFLLRPERVFMNRGNHEDLGMNVRSSFEPNFMSQTRDVYGKYGSIIFSSMVDLYSYLHFATILHNTITNTRYFIVHGGISDQIDLEYIQHKIQRSKFKMITRYKVQSEAEEKETKLITDLLWSDPIRIEKGVLKPSQVSSEVGCYFNEKRNCGTLFGFDLTKDFCERHNFNGIIRSHQVRDRGYSEDHEKCLTVFSASHYCGGFNYGAIFKFTPISFKPKPHRYKNKTGDISDDLAMQNHQLIKAFKRLIQENEKNLLPKFEEIDEKKKGFVKSEQWAEILSSYFKKEISTGHLRALKSLLCECDLEKDLVNYRTMFRRTHHENRKNKFYDKSMLYVIENLFQILDKDNDKRISVEDARQALSVLNQRLGENYSISEDAKDFIKQLDKNGDNQVDLDEFKRTFLEDENELFQANINES